MRPNNSSSGDSGTSTATLETFARLMHKFSKLRYEQTDNFRIKSRGVMAVDQRGAGTRVSAMTKYVHFVHNMTEMEHGKVRNFSIFQVTFAFSFSFYLTGVHTWNLVSVKNHVKLAFLLFVWTRLDVSTQLDKICFLLHESDCSGKAMLCTYTKHI